MKQKCSFFSSHPAELCFRKASLLPINPLCLGHFIKENQVWVKFMFWFRFAIINISVTWPVFIIFTPSIKMCHLGKTSKKIFFSFGQGPPPLIQAMPERKHFFSLPLRKLLRENSWETLIISVFFVLMGFFTFWTIIAPCIPYDCSLTIGWWQKGEIRRELFFWPVVHLVAASFSDGESRFGSANPDGFMGRMEKIPPDIPLSSSLSFFTSHILEGCHNHDFSEYKWKSLSL